MYRSSPFIRRADVLALQVHDGQMRAGGIPYIQHPRAVCRAVEHDGMPWDAEVLAAALLHDAVEDRAERVVAALRSEPAESGLSIQQAALHALGQSFSPRVAELVAWVTHGGTLLSNTAAVPSYAEGVLRLFALPDSGALRIKLADLAENALALDGIGDVRLRSRLTAKYRPAVTGVVAHLQSIRQSDPRWPLQVRWLRRFQTDFPPRE